MNDYYDSHPIAAIIKRNAVAAKLILSPKATLKLIRRLWEQNEYCGSEREHVSGQYHTYMRNCISKSCRKNGEVIAQGDVRMHPVSLAMLFRDDTGYIRASHSEEPQPKARKSKPTKTSSTVDMHVETAGVHETLASQPDCTQGGVDVKQEMDEDMPFLELLRKSSNDIHCQECTHE